VFLRRLLVRGPNDFPWGVVFSALDQRFWHPAQLYESVYHFALAALVVYRASNPLRQTIPKLANERPVEMLPAFDACWFFSAGTKKKEFHLDCSPGG